MYKLGTRRRLWRNDHSTARGLKWKRKWECMGGMKMKNRNKKKKKSAGSERIKRHGEYGKLIIKKNKNQNDKNTRKFVI